MITVGIITLGVVVLVLGVVLIVGKSAMQDRILDQIKRILEADTDNRSKIWLIKFLLEDEKQEPVYNLIGIVEEEPPKQVAGEELCKAEKLIIGEDARLSMEKSGSDHNR
jgi:hypothetical protein